MNNFPFIATNPDTSKKETFWYSRSVAVAGFIFIKRKNGWCILANKRGQGCPDFQGYWNCICGYLDFNETTKQAVQRECFEETGVRVTVDKIQFCGIDDSVDSNKQNVTIEYYATLKEGVNFDANYITSANSESNEIEDIRLISIKDIDDYKWAFGHKNLIKKIYNLYIKKSWYKRLFNI